MTLKRFNDLLKEVHPSLRVRQAGNGDRGGLFSGQRYIARITKGELNMNGYRVDFADPNDPLQRVQHSQIQKRGRKTLINMLRNYRWIKNHRQRSMLTWGISR